MGELIQIDFKRKQHAFSVEFYDEFNHVSRETVYAVNLNDVQAKAVSKLAEHPEASAIMVFPGTAEERRVGDTALLVMLQEDIAQFIKCKAGLC